MPEISRFYGIIIYMYIDDHNEWLDLHHDELMENWRLLSNSEAARKIEPLK